MKEKFKLNMGAYLEDIEMPMTFREKVFSIYEFYHKICPEEITDVFVSEYLNEDGTRQYENLWFFSENYCMEAKQFITKDDFDLIPTKGRLGYFQIQKEEYNFQKATKESKLFLFVSLEVGVTCSLKASKENCDYLKKISLKHLMPNLMK